MRVLSDDLSNEGGGERRARKAGWEAQRRKRGKEFYNRQARKGGTRKKPTSSVTHSTRNNETLLGSK